jgi:type IV secretion system protein VirB5
MNPFRRPAERYGASAPVETPFHRAAQEWDRRIGETFRRPRDSRGRVFESGPR